MKRALILVALAACGGDKGKPTAVTPMGTGGGMKLETNAQIASDDVAFDEHGRSIPGTLVHPTGSGKHRTVVLMAGSGPTDRNWNSPLLKGDNGSAKLLADELGKKGFVVLRFDKAMVGGNKIDPSKVTFETYVDEGRAALAYLRTRPEVDPSQLYVAGHSEGGIHAMRVALAEETKVAGLLLLSSPGRSMHDLILAQLQSQYDGAVKAGAIPKENADKEMTAIKQALDDFLHKKDVNPTTVSPDPGVQGLIAQLTNPFTAELARPLMGFDPANAIGKVKTRVFIYNGERDIQVDADIDGDRLAKAMSTATYFRAPDANHVLKHETTPIGQLLGDRAGVQNGYNSPEATLDPATLDAIAAFLAK